MTESLHDAHVDCLHIKQHEHMLEKFNHWLDESAESRTDKFNAAWVIHEQIDDCKADIELWQWREKNTPIPSEAIAAEQKLATLHQELASLNRQASGAEVVEPASGKVWTEARKAEAQQYRDRHGLKKTAGYYKVSQATISKHTTPKKKPMASPFAGLGSRPR